MAIPFVLASASASRRRLLQQAGIDPYVSVSYLDESQVTLSDPCALVQELALQKMRTSLQGLWQRAGSAPGGFFSQQTGVILGCDSILAIDGEIYGKPETPEIAVARWQQMRGRYGELFTGHALSNGYTIAQKLQPSQEIVRCQTTKVHFADISDAQIKAYVATGEPMQCSGCFALEGRGSFFIEGLEGCHTNVIGLSMPLLRTMLAEFGHDVTDFW